MRPQTHVEKDIRAITSSVEELTSCSKDEACLFAKANYERARMELLRAKEDYKGRIRPHLDSLEEKRQVLMEELDSTIKSKMVVVPEAVASWFKKYKAGVDFGPKGLKIVWVSPDKKHVIVKNSGSSLYNRIGSTTYCPTEHWLARVNGRTYLDMGNKYFVREGRLGKKALKEMIEGIKTLPAA